MITERATPRPTATPFPVGTFYHQLQQLKKLKPIIDMRLYRCSSCSLDNLSPLATCILEQEPCENGFKNTSISTWADTKYSPNFIFYWNWSSLQLAFWDMGTFSQTNSSFMLNIGIDSPHVAAHGHDNTIKILGKGEQKPTGQ